jgi:hypothetical protein
MQYYSSRSPSPEVQYGIQTDPRGMAIVVELKRRDLLCLYSLAFGHYSTAVMQEYPRRTPETSPWPSRGWGDEKLGYACVTFARGLSYFDDRRKPLNQWIKSDHWSDQIRDRECRNVVHTAIQTLFFSAISSTAISNIYLHGSRLPHGHKCIDLLIDFKAVVRKVD